jgi:hypothetical protein
VMMRAVRPSAWGRAPKTLEATALEDRTASPPKPRWAGFPPAHDVVARSGEARVGERRPRSAMQACAQCGAPGAAVCGSCWHAWPGVDGLAPSDLLWAATDRRQSAVVERLLAGPLTSLVGAVLAHAPALAADLYGSHALQSALAALGRALAAAPAPHLVAAAVGVADAVLCGSRWRAAVNDSCGTHVARSTIQLLAGAVPAAKRKVPKHGAPGGDAWPAAAFDGAAHPSLGACLERVAAAAAAALRTGGVRLGCDVHGAPVLCVLLQALSRQSRAAAADDVVAALLGAQRPAAVDALAASPAGSRVLEAALAAASPASFSAVFDESVLPRAAHWCTPASGAAHAPPPDAPPRISFILAADGGARAFKPGADESMWWCRRDAHVRIAASALWSGEGMPHAGVDDCALLYADASLMRMQADAVVARCAVPTEAAVVALWRDAAGGKRTPGVRAWRPLPDAPADDALAAAFAEMFSGYARAQRTGTTVLVLLHEDFSHELPVWGRQHGADGIARVIFLGGAVRDLTQQEEAAACSAARALGFLVVGCSLGRVPEFSSKIVAALNLYHANGRLVPAVASLCRRADAPRAKLPPAAPRRAKRITTLRFVLHVPFACAALTADVGRRAEMHTLLQSCVCALWRSRIVDEEHHAPGGAADPSCFLTVVFADGRALTDLGGGLVARLASAHQAAPSESQVLSALVEEAAAVAALPRPADDPVALLLSAHAAATVLSLRLAPSAAAHNLAALGFADRCTCDGAGPDKSRRGDVIVLLNTPAPDCRGVAVRLCPPGQAVTAAAAVTLLQQLYHHGRLFPALDLLAATAAEPPLAPQHSAPPLQRSGMERFVLAGCFASLHTVAQLRALLGCLERAGPVACDSATAGVLAAAARAALRLGEAHEDVARLVFGALDARADLDVWPSILCLGSAADAPCEAGQALLCALLQFPAGDATAPLRRGFRALLRAGGLPRLQAWALHADGSRALEAAMQPSAAALPRRLQRRAVRACLALLPGLAVHPKASWVVAALWGAAQGGGAEGARGKLRAEFSARLRAVPELRTANPRLWERCGLGQVPVAKRQKRV